MIKRKYPLILVTASLAFLTSFNLHAEAKNETKPDQKAKWQTAGKVDGSTHFGPTKCEDGWYPSMVVYGSLDMDNVLVKGELNVSGRAKLKSVEIEQNVLISGSIKARDLYVRGDVQIQGNSELREVTIAGSLDTKGNTFMKDLNLVNDLNVFGPLEAEDIVIQGATKLHGNINCKKALFQGEAELSGSILAKETFFEQPIRINSMFIKLIDVQTKSITLEDNGSGTPQSIKILGKSFIEGDITFNNQVQGNVVEIDKDSRITGKIVNGDLNLSNAK